MQHNCNLTQFQGNDSWVILSGIEQNIKKKIESVGIPLKDWEINIYRGILTGFNDAFIISSEKRDEILCNCISDEERSRTAEIIRPILRGRDIQRYSYDWADLFLIATFPSRHYDIDEYPSLKQFLLSFGMERLEQTGKKHIVNGEEIKSRKKTSNKWFETQDSISYWEDFSKPKIVYREIGLEMDACMVPANWFINNKLYMITGDGLENLILFLNSNICNKICLKAANITGGKGVDFMQEIRVPKLNYQLQSERELYDLYGFTVEEIEYLDNE